MLRQTSPRATGALGIFETVFAPRRTRPLGAAEGLRSGRSGVLVSPAAGFLLASHGVSADAVSGSHKLRDGRVVISKADALQAVRGKPLVPIEPLRLKSATAQEESRTSAERSAPRSAVSGTEKDEVERDQQEISIAGSGSSIIPTTVVESGRKFEDVPASTMRKVISTRLTEAKQSRPHFYSTIDCEIDNILAIRKRFKAKLGTAPSINDMVIKAASLALRDVPRVNCQLKEDGSILENDAIDVAVAVATPTGLITPIVKNSDQKGVQQISVDMRDLATRARDNKLKLEEFQGGSFAVSNLGMFGITDFTAVISPPHSAILAVGGGRQEFAVDESSGKLKVVNVLTVQLSGDRRVVDDVTAGRFLQTFQMYMSDPQFMIL